MVGDMVGIFLMYIAHSLTRSIAFTYKKKIFLHYYKDFFFFFHFSPDNRNTSCLSVNDNNTFTVEDDAWFMIRSEEDYDLYDQTYKAWLKINHSDSLKKY